mgnify:CR=1 FL=1
MSQPRVLEHFIHAGMTVWHWSMWTKTDRTGGAFALYAYPRGYQVGSTIFWAQVADHAAWWSVMNFEGRASPVVQAAGSKATSAVQLGCVLSIQAGKAPGAVAAR